MKKILSALAIAAIMLGFNTLSAQEKLSDENPDIARYTKALNLDETQQKQLKNIYAETEMKLQSNKEQTASLREERMAKDKTVTQDEKSAWSEEMDAASKERRMLVEERNKQMLDILDDKQLELYKAWREKRSTDEPSEETKEAPNSESKTLKMEKK